MDDDLKWRLVDRSGLLSRMASKRTDGVAEELLPGWAKSMDGFVGGHVYRDPEACPSLIGLPEPPKETGRMDLHRIVGETFKSDRWELAELEDGRVFSRGPKEVDYGHYLSDPPDWVLDPNGDGS